MSACHIEFAGIPGSGKSTLRKALLEALKRQGRSNCFGSEDAFIIVAREKMDRAYRMVLRSLPSKYARWFSVKIANRSLMQFDAQNAFLARYGEALRIFLSSESFKGLNVREREIVIDAFMSAGSLYQVISQGMPRDAAVFFDESFVQKTMMFVGSSGRESTERVSGYLRHVPVADYVIYVKADPASCVKRMKSRPRGLTMRLSGKDDAAISRFIEEAAAHMEAVMKVLRGDPRTRVVEVANDAPLAETVSRLAGMLPREIGIQESSK